MDLFDEYFIDINLRVNRSLKDGLGVFTASEIDMDVVVEYSPYSSSVRYKSWGLVPQELRQIVYSHPIGSDSYVIGLGYLSLYNHDDKYNCIWNTVEGGIYVYTLRKINAGEELYINYGDGYWKNSWKNKKV